MKTRTIKLSDNNDYTITSLTVGDLIEVEKKFGSLEINTARLENIVFWLWLSIRRKHKDMTIEKLYDLIDMPFVSEGKLIQVFNVMNELNGWDKVSEKNAPSPVKEQA